MDSLSRAHQQDIVIFRLVFIGILALTSRKAQFIHTHSSNHHLLRFIHILQQSTSL